MSWRAQLKNEVANDPKFETRKHRDKGREYENHYFDGKQISGYPGEWHMSFYGDDFSLDGLGELKKYIDFLTYYAYINDGRTRLEQGIYAGEEYGDTTATVEHKAGSGKSPSTYDIHFKGTDKGSILKLYHAIRAGVVRPTESWDAPQSGKSLKQILAELEAANQRSESEKDRANSLQEQLDAANSLIQTYRKENERLKAALLTLSGIRKMLMDARWFVKKNLIESKIIALMKKQNLRVNGEGNLIA